MGIRSGVGAATEPFVPTVGEVAQRHEARDAAICICGKLAVGCWWDPAELADRLKAKTGAIVNSGAPPLGDKAGLVDAITNDSLASMLMTHSRGRIPDKPTSSFLGVVIKRRIADRLRAQGSRPALDGAIKKFGALTNDDLERLVVGSDSKGDRALAVTLLRYRGGQIMGNLSLDELMEHAPDDGSPLAQRLLTLEDPKLHGLETVMSAVERVLSYRENLKVPGTKPKLNRVRFVLKNLLDGSMSKGEIADSLGVEDSVVSHDLNNFRNWALALSEQNPEFAGLLEGLRE